MRGVLERYIAGVCAAVLLTATPGCLLVGYSAEGDGSAIPPPDQRRATSPDAGLVASPDAGLVASPDAGPVAAADGGRSADVAVNVTGCGVLGRCLPACSSGSCRVDCAYSELCWTTCEANTSCAIDCSNGAICDLSCHAGARCEVDCRNNRDCDYLECAPGASCVLHCGNNLLGCSLLCSGVAMACANNVYVCDAPCPAAQ